MKKILAILLCAAFALVMFAGCKTQDTAETVKTGLAVVNSIARSADAGEADGLAETDSTIVAVTVDKDGRIVRCVIDSAQTKINFSAEGRILTSLDTVFKTKNELGGEYGMAGASSIGKEWNQQAEAFAQYAVGKTVAQIKGIAVNEEGVPTGSDLTASVTIHVGDFVAAIEKAVANAQDLGAASGDKLGIGVLTTISRSADAGDEDGLAQAYSTYAAATFGADGKITSCVIDASQSNINFSMEGKITTDLAAAPQTKNELGAAYGMAAASSIGKEWNEQAAAFASYVTGKTVAEVKGIAVDEEGVPTASDLVSSVTIHIGDFVAILEKSAASAK